MSNLYIYEQGSSVNYEKSRVIIKYTKDDIKSIPIENIDNIVIFGAIQVTTQCIQELLVRGVHLTWLSKSGAYFGRLEATTNINIERQRLQFKKSEDKQFSLNLSKQFIMGKILNQKTILIRANKLMRNNDLSNLISRMVMNLRMVKEAKTTKELMGAEGFLAKMYFQGINIVLDSKYKFQKRTKRPPKDPFNSLISFGYTLLHYEIYTILITKGLNPYAAFLHSDKLKHPTLCSDLMEEWRAILVDSLAIALLNNKKIEVNDFDYIEETGAVYLNKEGIKKFIKHFEKRLRQEVAYVKEVSYKMSFRRIIEYQVMLLIKALQNDNATLYKPILIR